MSILDYALPFVAWLFGIICGMALSAWCILPNTIGDDE